VVAAAANLAAQRAVLQFGDPATLLPFAIGTGTALGLGVKYLLDQRWIFRDGASGLRAHRDRFSRYTLMGLATTVLFWGIEASFWLVWRSEGMRELGAALGLGLGYWAKYHLDRRFVFVPSAAG
jgi:putative flippase GtrA